MNKSGSCSRIVVKRTLEIRRFSYLLQSHDELQFRAQKDYGMTDVPQTSRNHAADATEAINILVACRQDYNAILAAISPSKRGSRLQTALDHLEMRIRAGEQLWEERNDR